MVTISINIDILNPSDIIKKEKGKFAGFIADTFMSSEKQKNIVENEVRKKTIETLRNNLKMELEKRNIKARVEIY